jgi:D-alanyl-D-alanine carboxypeptidase/Putative Flp pilus-assembly TadE/G-like
MTQAAQPSDPEPCGRRAAHGPAERGQVLVLLLGAVFMLILGLGVLGAFGKALLGKGRHQRAADLAAVSAARSMRDDFTRLFEVAFDQRGRPNPRHLEKDEYLARARKTAVEFATLNGADARAVAVDFPDARSFAPLRVRVTVHGLLPVRAPGSPTRRVEVRARAEAELTPPGSVRGSADLEASGGGYSGPLAYRQGKPMRPDVALAFDRMAAAARREGVSLLVTSGYRSDAEQAELYRRHPDPKWVAPPGKSLHRLGTELDLGPPSAYGWLERNARRFHFVQRYPHEPWHYGLPIAL